MSKSKKATKHVEQYLVCEPDNDDESYVVVMGSSVQEAIEDYMDQYCQDEDRDRALSITVRVLPLKGFETYDAVREPIIKVTCKKVQ